MEERLTQCTNGGQYNEGDCEYEVRYCKVLCSHNNNYSNNDNLLLCCLVPAGNKMATNMDVKYSNEMML